MVEFLAARRIAVLADCHIHPGGGPDWTPRVLDALAGVDAILTLGDMGETAGLDRLAEIAPVYGVAGRDDVADPRIARETRSFRIGGHVVGLVFDPVAAGLAATSAYAFETDWTQRAEILFGQPIDMLLHASTHRSSQARIAGVDVVDPGSALLPEAGSAASFALICVNQGELECEIVEV